MFFHIFLILEQLQKLISYQIDCVVGPHLDMVVLFDIPALESELAGLRVEVDVLDGDGERRTDPIATRK